MELKDYIYNDELDLDKIIDDFSPYIKTIVNNMVGNNLSYEDKEEIFNMFYYSSKSIKDIAKKLNISEFNVTTRLYRIRKKLKKEFEKENSYGE